MRNRFDLEGIGHFHLPPEFPKKIRHPVARPARFDHGQEPLGRYLPDERFDVDPQVEQLGRPDFPALTVQDGHRGRLLVMVHSDKMHPRTSFE
jgi:hypothetical protein